MRPRIFRRELGVERKGHLIPPNKCDKCKSWNIALLNEAELYEKQRRIWPWVWYCYSCRAMVGCHYGTSNPLGYMADRNTRLKRARLHDLIDPLWKCEIFKREMLYEMIAELLDIDPRKCHISTLTFQQLTFAIRECTPLFNQHKRQLEKYERKQRADAKLAADKLARIVNRRNRNLRPKH